MDISLFHDQYKLIRLQIIRIYKKKREFKTTDPSRSIFLPANSSTSGIPLARGRQCAAHKVAAMGNGCLFMVT